MNIKESTIESVVQEFRDERSMELYGKPEFKLELAERQRLNDYIKDYNNPQWKPVIYNGNLTNYEINNIGNLRNKTTGKLLKAIKDKDGYFMYYFVYNKKLIGKGAHRLVGQAFIPNPNNESQIDHLNGIKSCNWYKNLEWVSLYENIRRAHLLGLSAAQDGENNPASKFKKEDILRALEIMNKNPNLSYTELSKLIGMSRTQLWNIKHKKRWTNLNSK